jgi:predicted DNA-binding transcriptional regulator AlpA
MQEEKNTGDRFLTVREVADMLHVCRASIYLWLKRDFPQPRKFGRASRWQSSELEEWIRKRPKGVYGEQRFVSGGIGHNGND